MINVRVCLRNLLFALLFLYILGGALAPIIVYYRHGWLPWQ